uniref:Nanos-like protein n=1 Tax=Schmidtea mediterranea TaxID=79327 RepID=A5Y5A4_SCHMD|nr:nanos-like protein [Schmidtea mediterranea]
MLNHPESLKMANTSPFIWQSVTSNNVSYSSNKSNVNYPRTNVACIIPNLLQKNIAKTDFSLLDEEDNDSLFRSDLKLSKELDRWVALLEAWPEKHITLDRSIWLRLLHKLRTSNQIRKESHIELCVFCRNNNEPFEMYVSHKVKDLNGKVTCPVLRNYTCPLCNSTGDFAHTIKYCPISMNTTKQVSDNSLEEITRNQIAIKSRSMSQSTLGIA